MRKTAMAFVGGFVSLQAMAMHPSWDADGDSVNDCENDGSCDHTVDYSEPRPESESLTPSFSCTSEALSAAERAVCAQPELVQMDLALDQAYQKLLTDTADVALQSHIKAVQRGWIKGRNECWKSAPIEQCVAREYQNQLKVLQTVSAQIDRSHRITMVCEPSPERKVVIRFYPTQPNIATLSWGERTSLLYNESVDSKIIYRGADAELHQRETGTIISSAALEQPLRCHALEKGEQ